MPRIGNPDERIEPRNRQEVRDARRHAIERAEDAADQRVQAEQQRGFLEPVRDDLAANIHTRNIPIVVVSGSPQDLGDRPVECVLAKPVMPETLVETVRHCLQVWKARQSLQP